MRASFLAAVMFGLAGTALLAGLGVWQIHRLHWKEGLIAELDAKLSAKPVPLPAAPDPKRDEFLRVRVQGTIGSKVIDLLTTERPWGPGFRVIAPLTLAGSGRTVLVDMGYIPEAMKDKRLVRGRKAEATGALFWPRHHDSFTPPPDLGRNIWFARDPAAMGKALGAEPVLIVADDHDLGKWPMAIRLGVNLPNNHLTYAITWFSLAVMWAVMSLMLARRERARRPA